MGDPTPVEMSRSISRFSPGTSVDCADHGKSCHAFAVPLLAILCATNVAISQKTAGHHRSIGTHRTMEEAIPYDQAAQRSGMPATGARGMLPMTTCQCLKGEENANATIAPPQEAGQLRLKFSSS